MKKKFESAVDGPPSLSRIFFSMLRLGATAFGGPSMVSYIHRDIVEKKHWLFDEDYRDGVALCQVIPGPTTMQMAGYIGLKMRGLIGAIISFTGFGLPAFTLMVCLTALYQFNHNLPLVTAIFGGLQAIIVAMIAYAMFSFGKTSRKDWKALLIAGIAAGLFGLNVHPILVILASALLGVLIHMPIQRSSVSGPTTLPGHNNNRQVLIMVIILGICLLLLYLINRNLFDLAALMAKISLFSFGGGFASIPLMSHEIVEVHGWMDNQTFMNGIVLGQVTPGPVVITATYVGYLLHGALGAVIATLAVFLPSFIVLVAASPYFDRFRSSPYFSMAIFGVLGSFIGLLLTVTIRFGLVVQWDIAHILLAVAAFIAFFRRVDILWVILAGTVLSALVYFL
jgi:chromate transporter